MPAWPKSFYTFRANLLTAGAEWRLRQKRGAARAQQRTFGELTRRLSTTSFWREAGVTPGTSYDRFQTVVPPRTYEHFEPAIARVRAGEADVLWPGRCALFALSAGTTTGRSKLLPVTDEMLGHFRRAGLDSLLYYTVRMKHAAVFRGRHVLLGGCTALTALPAANGHDAYAGNLSGITALNLPGWAEKHLFEPGVSVAQIIDWSARLEAIVARTRSLDITMVAGFPNWVLMLAAALRANSTKGKGRISNLQGLWPNLECFMHSGLPLSPFWDEALTALGPTVNFHEVYHTAEGLVAAQDIDASQGMRLMADTGIFYEFIPMADYVESRLEQLGPKAVPLVGVKAGIDYAVLVTTPAGLARYVLGDIVRFTSTEPPRLVYVGRTGLSLVAFGENVLEREITEALVTVCRRNRWTIVNFHVAPEFAPSATGKKIGHHQWWIELKPGTVTTPTGQHIAAELDAELQRLNETYLAKRRGGGFDAPVVRLVMPGVFEHWLRYQGKWDGQHKMPRCRSDRLVADELAQITNFAHD
jgi:hypothetical protein